MVKISGRPGPRRSTLLYYNKEDVLNLGALKELLAVKWD